MNKEFEKIIEKLEELQNYACFPTEWVDEEQSKIHSYYANKLTEILKLTEQYNNGWIPCSERLPEESGEYLTWVEYDGDRFIAIDEIDCDGIIKEWNCSADYKVIAWQQLLPYQPKGE